MNHSATVISGGSGDLSSFREQERARQNLERIAARTPSGFIATALGLLADSPNPDQALNLLERLATLADAESVRLLHTNPTLLHYVIVIFSRSHWLGETILHNLDLLGNLAREKNLERSFTSEEYRLRLADFRSRAMEPEPAAQLARFRKREYVRILLRDALGIATLAETTQEISALSDAVIAEALSEVERAAEIRAGTAAITAKPRTERAPFAVIALGKLGGNELNYSSDVDLLFLHGAGSPPSELDEHEHFIHQAQMLTEVLSRATPEGAVFRIDLRLRPQGREGEPAVSLDHALHYYAQVAHDWELQALIKARYVAGDRPLATRFIAGVQERVYQKDINFAAIETAWASRQKLTSRRRTGLGQTSTSTTDVKLDRGGIRDIEFLVQCLQRVYGGEEKWLHSGGTLFSLQKLHDKEHLTSQEFHQLTHAYELLRRIEHSLQVQRGQQLHRLPAGTEELQVLERSLSYGLTEAPSCSLFGLRACMAQVAEIYDRVVHSERHSHTTLSGLSETSVREMSWAQLVDRITLDSPALGAMIARPGLGLHARRQLHRFLSSALTSAERYAPLREQPELVERAVALFETSDYLTDILVRHPDAIRALVSLNDQPLQTADCAPRSVAADGDRESALRELRREFRKSIFSVGAKDVLATRPAFESLSETTRIGDAVIRSALGIVNGARSLAVFALGRLGSEEFDIASDADLLFVRAPEASEEEARLDAERLVHALSAYTRDGSIFAVDARLRPHGGAGDLVVTAAQISKYLEEEAQPWEALSYSKLRFIGGREDLAPSILTGVWHQIVEIAARSGFRQAVVDMRERLEKTNRYPRSFKKARGGFYDIDFVVSYLMLRGASLAPGNTLDRLQHLRHAGLLDEGTLFELNGAAILYRTVDHVIRLVTGRVRPELPEGGHARAAIEDLVHAILHSQTRADLQGDLSNTAAKVRAIFERVLAA